MPYALLADRAVLAVTGETASEFLQNLVTSDVDAIGASEACPSALLTPQGKILFDFLLSRIDGGFRIDVATRARADLAKRLTLYRLRAKIEIAPRDEAVFAVWPEATGRNDFADRRFADGTVFRSYGPAPEGLETANAQVFERMRLRAGIAEAERDFPASDVFPHDVLLDQNGGVSFRKGCYVGQEVVSRMQHRGTARRRLMLVEAEAHLTPGSDLVADERTLGTLLSSSERQGIALVRIDRLAAALTNGAQLSVDGVPVDATIPAWAAYRLPDAAMASAEE